MSDFLLVHGSCHGAWCWRDLIPALEAQGHTARAIDLPGHGDDTTEIDACTLDGCRDAVLAATTPETVVLGHSWGGFPISAAAEANPGAMRGLIFLCAYVPTGGRSMVDMRKAGPRQPVLEAVIREPDGLSYTIAPEKARGLFYHDCPDDAVRYAIPRLCPQAIAPQVTPLPLSARFDGVPKHFIRCADDQTIPPEYQQEMTRDWPSEHVHVLGCSHSPFFADPQGLAALMAGIAQEF